MVSRVSKDLLIALSLITNWSKRLQTSTILPSVVSTKLIMITILRCFVIPRLKLTSLSMTRICCCRYWSRHSFSISWVHKTWSWASSSAYKTQSSKELKRCLGMFAHYARWIRNFSGKIKPLTAGKMDFPLQSDAVTAFESLRELLSACLKCIKRAVHCWMRCLGLCNCRRPQPRRTTCCFHVTHLV